MSVQKEFIQKELPPGEFDQLCAEIKGRKFSNAYAYLPENQKNTYFLQAEDKTFGFYAIKAEDLSVSQFLEIAKLFYTDYEANHTNHNKSLNNRRSLIQEVKLPTGFSARLANIIDRKTQLDAQYKQFITTKPIIGLVATGTLATGGAVSLAVLLALGILTTASIAFPPVLALTILFALAALATGIYLKRYINIRNEWIANSERPGDEDFISITNQDLQMLQSLQSTLKKENAKEMPPPEVQSTLPDHSDVENTDSEALFTPKKPKSPTKIPLTPPKMKTPTSSSSGSSESS